MPYSRRYGFVLHTGVTYGGWVVLARKNAIKSTMYMIVFPVMPPPRMVVGQTSAACRIRRCPPFRTGSVGAYRPISGGLRGKFVMGR